MSISNMPDFTMGRYAAVLVVGRLAPCGPPRPAEAPRRLSAPPGLVETDRDRIVSEGEV